MRPDVDANTGEPSGPTVRIGLPLAADVVANVCSAIADRWPDSTMLMKPSSSEGGDQWLTLHLAGEMVLPSGESVPSEDRDERSEVSLTSAEDGTLTMGLTEWMATNLVGVFRQILDDADAPNFIQALVGDPATGEQYTVTIGRPRGKTPGQIHREDMERIRELEVKLAEATRETDPQELHGDTPSGGVDREPQPGDGPEYHEDHAAWVRRQYTMQDAYNVIRAANVPIVLGDLCAEGGNVFVIRARLKHALEGAGVPTTDQAMFRESISNMDYGQMLDLVRELFDYLDDEFFDDPRFSARAKAEQSSESSGDES